MQCDPWQSHGNEAIRTIVRLSSPPAAIFSFAQLTRSKPCTVGKGKPTLTRTANGNTPQAEANVLRQIGT